MAKKIVLGLVLATLVAGGIFAHETDTTNWVSGQIGLINAGIGYERVISPQLSIGGEVYWNSFFILWNSTCVEAYAKYYPFNSNFYVKVGLGYGTVTGTEDVTWQGYSYSWSYSTSGLLIDPAIGWKIDVGKPGGFFIEPKIGIPIVFGTKNYDGVADYLENGEFKIGTNFVIAFGMGYTF